jgi:hypothetical protein
MKGAYRIVSLIIFASFLSQTSNACHQYQNAGGITPIRSMARTRAAHTATLLPTGNVLIAGGFAGDEQSLASAEVFDPTQNTFVSAASMNVSRSGHTATLLPNGKVLIAGGYNGNYLSSAELYDPVNGTFTPTNTMRTARSGHVAVILPNGKVLLAGGVGIGWTFLRSAELYDPATNSFAATGDMLSERESHSATLLANGKVLIAGGHRGRRPSITIHSSAEIYDPATGRFSATGDMTRIRHKHEGVLLADGRVLIVGGADERDGHGAYSSAETYDSARGTFTATGEMNSPRYKLQGTVVLLNNGKVLIAGGANRAEVFDPSSNKFSYARGDMGTPRLFATATRLRTGQVLIVGGYNTAQEVSEQAWLFRS